MSILASITEITALQIAPGFACEKRRGFHPKMKTPAEAGIAGLVSLDIARLTEVRQSRART
jgi:hypothetical protein